MADQKSTAALRKRAQISRANRTMFLWVAACSAIAGAAVVVSYFMIQTLIYNEKVLAAKFDTVSTLNRNIEVIPDLEAEVRVLDTNEALQTSKANPDDQALQVILDALPAEANSLALGASLQDKLLAGISGLQIESLQVNPVVGVESVSSLDVIDAGTTEGSGFAIDLRFTVIGSQDALEQVLDNLERSIRQIDLATFRIESRAGAQELTVAGRAYYEPAVSAELTEETVRR